MYCHVWSLALLASLPLSSSICPYATDVDLGEELPCMHTDYPEGAAPDVTVDGCTCVSTCGTGIRDFWSCDFCFTEPGCGQPSGETILDQVWTDICVYPPNIAYERWSAKDKTAALWDMSKSPNEVGAFPPNTNGIHFGRMAMFTTFANHKDTIVTGRPKVVHAVGAVCKFKLHVHNHSPFSGVLQAGERAQGLIRLGSATPVNLESGIAASAALKFLRKGRESANLVLLKDLIPKDQDYNFFNKPLSNHVIPGTTREEQRTISKFITVSSCPVRLGASDMCAFDTDGRRPEEMDKELVFPYQIVLDPNPDLATSAAPADDQTLMDRITAVARRSTVLYTMRALASPGGDWITLGDIRTSSDCVTSTYGDKTLFFKHQKIEDDWDLRPDFYNIVDAVTECGFPSDGEPIPQTVCHEDILYDTLY